MSERTQVFVTLFSTPADRPRASVHPYGDKEEQQATELRIAGHLITVHGLSTEQLYNLGDDLYSAGRTLEERSQHAAADAIVK